jgi:hypothetical protein
MKIGDKYFMKSNLQRPVYISTPGDRDVYIAERPEIGNYSYTRYCVLRSMLLTPAERDVEVAKEQAKAERRERWKLEQRQDGFRSKGNS